MKWIESVSGINKEDIIELLEKYENLGPLPGIFLPFLEAFLSFLPLLVIIIGNAAAYGLWKGFIYSWLGTVGGGLCVFGLTRRFGKRFSAFLYRKYPKARSLFDWVERKGFTPIFIMACLPFSPSFLINILSGLTKISFASFFWAVFLGKGFMVFLVSWVGHDFFSILVNPWKLILVVSLFFIVWIAGRRLEARYRKKHQN